MTLRSSNTRAMKRQGGRSAPDAIFLLPSLGQPSERLLADYAGKLLANLRRLKGAGPAVQAVEEATADLQRAVQARELCRRLAAAADAFAARVEREAEERLHEFFVGCGGGSRLQQALFPAGLEPLLAPRGAAQVSTISRLLHDYAKLDRVSPRIDAPTLRLALAGLELAERCAASAQAHASLVDAITAEHQQQRLFRQSCHDALGVVVALHPRGSTTRRSFELPAPVLEPLPAAPPLKSSGTTSKPRRSRKGSRRG
jgi:hypothetical protein